jgi:hypothetical protein
MIPCGGDRADNLPRARKFRSSILDARGRRALAKVVASRFALKEQRKNPGVANIGGSSFRREMSPVDHRQSMAKVFDEVIGIFETDR